MALRAAALLGIAGAAGGVGVEPLLRGTYVGERGASGAPCSSTQLAAGCTPSTDGHCYCFTPLPLARQTQHQKGTPHTDKVGRVRTTYQAGESFLPIGLYAAIIDQRLPNGQNYSAADYKKAGFNTLHIYPGTALQDQINYCSSNGFQAIPEIGTSSNGSSMSALVAPFAGSDSVLGWFLDSESVGHYQCFKTNGTEPAPGSKCTTAWAAYLTTKKAIKSVDTKHAVFNLGCPWFAPDSDGRDPSE